MMTYKRCDYAKNNEAVFDADVRAIMCTPDWKPWVSIVVENQKSQKTKLSIFLGTDSVQKYNRIQMLKNSSIENEESVQNLRNTANEFKLDLEQAASAAEILAASSGNALRKYRVLKGQVGWVGRLSGSETAKDLRWCSAWVARTPCVVILSLINWILAYFLIFAW